MNLNPRRWFGRTARELAQVREEMRLLRDQREADQTRFKLREEHYARLLAGLTGSTAPGTPVPEHLTSDLAEIKLRESWPGWFNPSGFGNIINPLGQFYDGITPLLSTVPTLWDYTLNLGFYVTEAWLDILRMYARVWYAVTPQAQGVMRSKKDYVIHTGFDYQMQPKDGMRVAKDLPNIAQRIVDDFLTKNNWYETECDWHLRLSREGEVFPRLFERGSGITQVRTVEPWQVRGENTSPENMLGVLTRAGDRECVEAYRVTMSGSGTDAERVEAFEVPDEDDTAPPTYGRMTHFKVNTDKQVKRGVSDFVATQQLFRDLTRLMQNTQVGEALRQALVWIQETTGAANPLTEISGTTGTAPPTGFCFSSPGAWGPGQIPTMDVNLQMKPGPIGNCENARVALTLAYQALSTYFRVPEWMVSGTSDANFASSLTQESPLVRMAQSEQKLLKSKFGSVVMQALRIAEEQELLEPGSVDKLHLNVEATPLVVRDPKSETERNQILSGAGILSKKTWSVREDLERDTEKENLEEEAKEPPLTPPAPPMPGQPPAAPSNTPAAQYQRQTQQTAIRESWSEDEHPRDDEGRFVSAKDIRDASRDTGKADQLRSTVTDPKERAKLDALLSNAKPFAGKRRSAQAAEATAENKEFLGHAGTHAAEGEEHAHIVRSKLVTLLKSAPDEPWDEAQTKFDKARDQADHNAGVHWDEAKAKAEAQFRADYDDLTDAELQEVSDAFDEAKREVQDAYWKQAHEAKGFAEWLATNDYAERQGGLNNPRFRRDFEEASEAVGRAYRDAQAKVWDAVQKLRDAKGGKAKGFKLGRYFK